MRIPAFIGALAILAGASVVWAQPQLPPPRPSFAHLAIGAPAPDFTLAGTDGGRHQLSDYRGKIVVIEWTSPVCPFTASKYKSGAMQRLQADAARRGIVWLSINTSAPGKPGYLTVRQAKARLVKVKSKPAAFLFDDGTAGRLYGARTTPSAYIVGRDGLLLYQGAVDDDQMARGHVTVDHIHDALADIRANRPVRMAETRPYGCAIEY